MRFCWHNWSVWGPEETAKYKHYSFGSVFERQALVQRRTCSKCGKIIIRKINE